MISIAIDRDIRRLKQVRIAQALASHAPDWVRLVQDAAQADVQIVQASTLDVRRGIKAKRYAVIQHAHRFEHRHGTRQEIVVPKNFPAWETVWRKALAIWSPYDIASELAGKSIARLHHAPFGVDLAVFRPSGTRRDVGIITSGASNFAEAIAEPAAAAHKCSLTTVHSGPWEVDGMAAAMPGRSILNSQTDNELAAVYSRALWVSGLRHQEGFELPPLEGLACGARPVVFETPDNRSFYGDHAVYLPHCKSDELVEYLTKLMEDGPMPVSAEERQQVQERYDWATLARGYWQQLEAACLSDVGLRHLVSAPPPPASSRRISIANGQRKLLWIGDSPTTAWTGFGRASINIIKELQAGFEVHVCGTTYDGCPYLSNLTGMLRRLMPKIDEALAGNGDPAALLADVRSAWQSTVMPYDIYPISKGIDEILRIVQPDVVVAQHDPWHVQNWLRAAGKTPVVGIMPIDGRNCRTDYLNELAMAIWWTKTSEQEARLGGYTGPSRVVPLGVDLETFKPMDKRLARANVGLPPEVHDKFLVGCVARNQPRKRLDLLVRHFAEWVHTRDIRDAYLYVQTAPTSEAAYDVASLMRHEKLEHRMLLVTPAIYRTLPEATQAGVFNSLDVYFTTTQGEGWGLPVMEAMACGVPVVAPDWSALGDWAKDAAVLVPCNDIAGTINSFAPQSGTKIAVLGGVPDKAGNIAALESLYADRKFYEDVRARGLARVAQPEFRWEAIGQEVLRSVEEALLRRMTGGVMEPVLK